MRHFYLLRLLAVVAVPALVRAQDLPELEHLASAADRHVWAIAQDETGFLWLGTETGLLRYDGYEYRQYRSVPGDPRSLGDDRVRSLYVDPEGTLWVGTTAGGISRYNAFTDSFTRYQHDPDDPASLSDNEVRCIYGDASGAVWICTGNGLNRFDPQREAFLRIRHDPRDRDSLSHDRVESVVQDRKGTLWVGTFGGGVNRMVPGTEHSSPTFTHYRQHPTDRGSLSDDRAVNLIEDRSGSIWVATWGGGLNRFDPRTERFEVYRHDPEDPTSLGSDYVRSMREDRSGALWITTADGLSVFDIQTQTFTNGRYDPDNRDSVPLTPTNVYQDATGSIWVGSYGHGLSVLHPGKRLFSHHGHDPDRPDSLIHDYVTSLYRDRAGHVWIGTMSGLSRLEPDRWTFTNYRHDPLDPESLSHATVTALSEDRHGSIWVATLAGLNRLDPKSDTFTRYVHDADDPSSLPDDSVSAVVGSLDGEVWVGTAGAGLSRLDPRSGRFEPVFRGDDGESRVGGWIYTLYEDRGGNIWVGSETGLYRWEPASGRLTPYLHDPMDPDGISHGIVQAVYEDGNGVLWMGADAVHRFVPAEHGDGSFVRYSREDGFPFSWVQSIIDDDDGNLWISTARSEIFRLDPVNRSVVAFDESDGLRSRSDLSQSVVRTEDGTIIFGGSNGLNVFRPEDIELNTHVPRIVITDFQIARRPVPVGGDSVLQRSIVETRALTLSYEDRLLTFDFAALDYTAPERNRYRYILEGFEETWHETDATIRQATYTNLAPGEYVFRVIGSNNHGVWNEDGAAIQITVIPPWWSTWWFRALAVSTFLGILLSLHRHRMRYISRANLRLEEEIAERKRAEHELKVLGRRMVGVQEEDRAQIARDLHDDLNQQLAAATIGIDLAKSTIATAPDQTAARLDDLKNQLDGLSDEVRRISHELHPETLRHLGITTALEVLCEESSGIGTAIRASITNSVEEVSPEAALCLYRIAQEALQNVFRHAAASEAVVELSVGSASVQLTVRDNGRGFDPESAHAGMGLSSMRERARLLDGTLQFVSEPGRGTEVRVELPLGSSSQRQNP